MEQQKLWVEPVGGIIIARLRGVCTEDILKECQERVLELTMDTNQVKVLYDTLEMEAPAIDLVLAQQKLETEMKKRLGQIPLRKAILVPNTKLAYLARIAFGQFGEGEYRVFYNDITQAVRWLEE
jgi:hypothetical protein